MLIRLFMGKLGMQSTTPATLPGQTNRYYKARLPACQRIQKEFALLDETYIKVDNDLSAFSASLGK
jgi:hypothetical protein